jgi:drug/metabolite transporter (DMT)-like permease
MWILPALLSAVLLGFYDVFKKQSLKNNAVIPVLFLNTMFSSIIFIPVIIASELWSGSVHHTLFYIPHTDLHTYKYILLKSCIVLSSWISGYFAMKHLPLTIVGPINTTRPVMVLMGAMLIFGERLNIYQWIGVMLAVISFYMLSRSGKHEGINFRTNKWIYFLLLAGILGAASGLYDKYLMAPVNEGGLGINPMAVQSWFNIFQFAIMGAVLLILWYPERKSTTPFHWDWSIIFISIFLAAADFFYFYSLSLDGAMISIVSMIRRSSVIVSFISGALIFNEKNLKSKTFDLLLVLIGLIFLYIGSK